MKAIDLPVWVSPRFSPLKEPSDGQVLSAHDLKPGYLLSFVQDQNSIGRILEVWRWLTDTVDPGGPLILMGLMDEWVPSSRTLIHQLGLEDWVRVGTGTNLTDLPALFRQAACYFHGAPSRTGQELRWALATGVPVAGIETTLSSRVLGEAGYLAPPRDVRALVAACITVIVEPQMADVLRKRGLSRARDYHHDRLFEYLVKILRGAS
jgi:glycosyltransferase involved in cell wall biosynthesis